MRTKTLALPIIAAMLSACNQTASFPAPTSQLSEANARIDALERQVKALNVTLDALQQQQAFYDFYRTIDRLAYLTPGDEGYSAIRFDLGTLTVKLDDIKPYANGSKVALQIGNTLFARIDGLKAKIEWGKVDDKGMPINETIKSKEVTLNESLRPGAWTKTSIVLDGVAPNELGFVRLKEVTHRGIVLMK